MSTLYEKPLSLTIDSVQQIIDRHRISITIGFSVASSDIPEGMRWFAFLPDQCGKNHESRVGDKTTGRASPNGAVLDLFWFLAGETIHFDYDFGRAFLAVTLPHFHSPSPPAPTAKKRTPRRRK